MRLWAVCILLLVAPLCAAETITFRSGEHPTFSRLVLDIPIGADWRLGRIGQDYALQVDPEHDFDTRAAFDRISRDRLSALAPIPGTGRLMLEIVCDCHATAFPFAPDKLVIDIADGPAPAGSVFEASLDAVIAESPVPPVVAEIRQTVLPLGQDLLPDPFAATATADPRIAAAQMAILDSLARAASQGLLDIDHSAPANPETAAIPDAAASPMPIPSLPQPEPGQSRAGVSVQTSIDRDRPSGIAGGTTMSGSACLDDSLFDLAVWGDDSGYSAQIGARLSALTTERDLVAEGAVENLARTYLHFGFGAEAEQALALDGQRTPEREVLRAVGRIIDEETVETSVFQDQIGCGRPVALWSALARGTLAGTTEPERIAILSAHRVLPIHLRNHLGRRLAKLFLDAGEAETAQAIIATGENGGDPMSSLPSLTDAQVSLALAGPTEALETLETLAAEENRMTPEALVALIDLSLAESRTVSEELLNLAASLRFENRGTGAETALGLAELRVLTNADRFADAMALLTDELANLPAELRRDQISGVIAEAAARMQDAAFLEFAFGPLPQPLSSEAENIIAARLLDLGFPDAAAGLVDGSADTDAMADRRRLRARADMALGHRIAGEEELAGMTDPGSDEIRGTVVAEAFAGLVPEELWRAGDWHRLEQTEDPLLKAASAAMMEGLVITDPDSSLADRQALLDQAAATRMLATDLLDRFIIDPGIPAN